MGKRLPAWAFDVGLAAGLYALDVTELLTVKPDAWGWGLVIDGVACALLVFRRRAPILVGTLVPLILLSTTMLGSGARGHGRADPADGRGDVHAGSLAP